VRSSNRLIREEKEDETEGETGCEFNDDPGTNCGSG